MSGTPPPNEQDASDRRGLLGKILLGVASVLLVGWLGWLSYTALTKSHEPTVSRAQSTAAAFPVVAEVKNGEQDREVILRRPGGIAGESTRSMKEQADKPGYFVEVVEQFHPNAPAVGKQIGVTNLPIATGYSGPGTYLLLLYKEPDSTLDASQPRDAYSLAGPQRSPGADLEGGSPMIYKWGPDVKAQLKRLFPTKD